MFVLAWVILAPVILAPGNASMVTAIRLPLLVLQCILGLFVVMWSICCCRDLPIRKAASGRSGEVVSARHAALGPQSKETLTCRLLSGQVLHVDLCDAIDFRKVRGHIANALCLDSPHHDVMVLCDGELLDDSAPLHQLLQLQRCHGEVTVVVKTVDLWWEPEPGTFHFPYGGKEVEKVIRSSCAKSGYMISYRDGSWFHHQGTPQLDLLFTTLAIFKRRGLGGQ
mmetsp:Transcript_67765/g.118836  ORF Transcript_67765/g.118836 Transcript_67765/m.118836 type:complete len:225 (-) Transcript_67765:75-749(-)